MPTDIKAFFEAYRDAFNALDGHAVAALYAEPSGIAQDGVYTHWANRAPVTENMVALCGLYQDRGFLRADFEPLQCIDQGRHHAVADLRWRLEWRSRPDPWLFRTTYNLIRSVSGWRVLLCTAHSEAALHGANAAG